MKNINNIPTASYGILQQEISMSALDEAAEQIRHLGYAILDSGYIVSELQTLSEEFDKMQQQYVKTYGLNTLRNVNEQHTIRSPLLHGGELFLNLALNENLLSLVKKLIPGKFILNQQNGIINPPQETYDQGAWHRDLPYQHFVSTKPLGVNALFCVDDFNIENGGIFVLPATHKSEAFPSDTCIQNNATQVEAKAGSFILLDCMIYHAGGLNKTNSARRAVNQVFNIPYFKQQINIPKNIESTNLSDESKDILGFNYAEPVSISDYLSKRKDKAY